MQECPGVLQLRPAGPADVRERGRATCEGSCSLTPKQAFDASAGLAHAINTFGQSAGQGERRAAESCSARDAKSLRLGGERHHAVTCARPPGAVRRSVRHDFRLSASRPALVRRACQGPALAGPGRLAVVGARQRGDAAADPGQPGTPCARGLAGALAHPGGAGRGHRGRCCPPVGPARIPAAGSPAACERPADYRQARRPGARLRCRATRAARRGLLHRRRRRQLRVRSPARGAGRQGQPRPAQSAAELALAESLLPADGRQSARWSVGIMELGALVCTASRPGCDRCPLSDQCEWLRLGRPPAPAGRAVPAYQGSDRQCRGALLAVLRAASGPVPARALDVAWHDSGQRVRSLAALMADGLVTRCADGSLALPGDAPP
jgi:hypothetical protein